MSNSIDERIGICTDDLNLTEAQWLAVNSLLRGASQKAAARAAGAGERTIRDWMTRPAFRQALRAGRDALLRETCTLLQAETREAVRALVSVLRSKDARGYEKVAAARVLLDVSHRITELTDHADRLADLEEKVMAG